MTELKDLKNKDLYQLFEIKQNATVKEIKKAYRKKALKLHPDKNPDDPKAAAMFHELSEALKILTDLGARAAYDHVRNARKAAAERTEKLDDKRKKVKLDLEAREKAAEMQERDSMKTASRTLKQEIERLREEGSRILQEEQIAMKKLLREEAEERKNNLMAEPARLKIKWNIKDGEENLYSRDTLMKIFMKYGNIVALIVSMKKKKGSAVIEFTSAKEAQLAHDSEVGFPENPLSIMWLSGKPADLTAYAQHFTQKLGLNKDVNRHHKNGDVAPKSKYSEEPSSQEDDDFESQVLERMRKMQEQKRQQKEDEKT